jgi:type IV secretion system protein VirD4
VRPLQLLWVGTWVLLVVPLLLISSAVALRFGWADELGVPLASKIYAPLAALEWWRGWGYMDAYRSKFLQGVGIAFIPSVLAMVSLLFRGAIGPMPLRDKAQVSERHFGTVADLKKRDVSGVGDGIVIGKNGGEILRVGGDQHVLVMGPSGGGKGVGYVIPTLLEHHGSMLVHDPKHELAGIVGRYRRSLGPTWVFDPTNRHSHSYNPMLELRGRSHGDRLHGDCQQAATLICHTGASKDPVWEDAAAELLSALMLVAFEHDQPTLSYVHDLVLRVSGNRMPKSQNDFVGQILASHEALETRVRSSVNFELRTRMSFMSDPTVRATTSASEFRAGDLFCGDRPTTIFLTVPPADRERLRPLLRLLVQTIMNVGLHDVETVADGRAKERGALLLFDEFPALQRMPFLETNLQECRGYGIRCMLVCQDVEQIKRSYTERQAITGNCGTIVLLPGFSGGLSEVMEWGGWTLESQRSRGREMLRPLSVRSSESEERTPLLDAGALLTDERALIFRLKCRPTFLERVRHYEEPRWAGRWDGR